MLLDRRGQRTLHLATGEITGMDHATGAMPSFLREVELAPSFLATELRSEFDQGPHAGGPLANDAIDHRRVR